MRKLGPPHIMFSDVLDEFTFPFRPNSNQKSEVSTEANKRPLEVCFEKEKKKS